MCFNLISFSHKVCKNVSQVQNKAKRFSQPLFWCFFPQRLPKQIEERNERLKEEMLGKSASLTFSLP